MFDVHEQTHVSTAHAGHDKCLDSLSMNYGWYNSKL